MRRALLLVVLAGCGASPDDLFILSGRTVGADGAPLDGVDVTAARIRFWPMQETLRTVQSADGGQFSFELVRAEIESLSRENLWFTRVEASFPSGAQTWTDLALYPPQLKIPTLYDWPPGFTVVDGGVVAFTPIAPVGRDCTGLPETGYLAHAVVVTDEHGQRWQQSDLLARHPGPDAGLAFATFEARPIVLHPDVLEDGPLSLSMEAKRFGCFVIAGGGVGGAEAHIIETHWRNPTVRFIAGTRRPASRGAACPEVRAGICPVTDASSAPFLLPRPMLRFRLTLRDAAAIQSVVLRNVITPYDLPHIARLELRAGGDEQIVHVPNEQVTLTEAIALDDDTIGRVDWKHIVLPRPLAKAQEIELELDTPVLQLGEISLFE